MSKVKRKTVNDLIARLQTLKKEGFGDFPIIYARDEEGNGYHHVVFDANTMAIEDLEEGHLSPVFSGSIEDKPEPNCVIIN